jgi:uncharacterized protein YdbL (DUF1318 family)
MFALKTIRHQGRVTNRLIGMTRARSAATAILVAFALSFATIGPMQARAESLLDTAKATGQVGEQFDGYVGLIDQSAPDNIKKMVKDTNQRRRARYGGIAKKRGTTLESVGKLAGVKILSRVKPGEMFQTNDGSWSKK